MPRSVSPSTWSSDGLFAASLFAKAVIEPYASNVPAAELEQRRAERQRAADVVHRVAGDRAAAVGFGHGKSATCRGSRPRTTPSTKPMRNWPGAPVCACCVLRRPMPPVSVFDSLMRASRSAHSAALRRLVGVSAPAPCAAPPARQRRFGGRGAPRPVLRRGGSRCRRRRSPAAGGGAAAVAEAAPACNEAAAVDASRGRRGRSAGHEHPRARDRRRRATQRREDQEVTKKRMRLLRVRRRVAAWTVPRPQPSITKAATVSPQRCSSRSVLEASAIPQGLPDMRGHRGRILIVDDESNARAALSEILREDGLRHRDGGRRLQGPRKARRVRARRHPDRPQDARASTASRSWRRRARRRPGPSSSS